MANAKKTLRTETSQLLSHPTPPKKFWDISLSFGGSSLAQKAVFAKNLALMLRSGLTITQALSIISDSSTGNLRQVTIDLLKSVQSGNSLAESFARYPHFFSEIFIDAAYAGEASGTLEGGLEAIAEQLRKEKELIAKVKQALLYPVMILAASFVLGLAITFFVLPKITPLFAGMRVELPWSTRVLMNFSEFVTNHGVALILSLLAGIAFLAWLLPRKFMRPLTHYFLLKFPIISRITRNANLAQFCRNLNTMLKAGVSIDRALEVTKRTLGNYYYQKALQEIDSQVSSGSTLSEGLKNYSHLFPLMLTRMVVVGEQSGRLEEALLYLAGFYDEEVDNATKYISTIIEPVLLLVIGCVVAFLTLSIITPIYNITGNIR